MNLTIKSVLICTLIGLLASRTLVICHEIIGHAIPILIEGGQIRGCILYFFGAGALVSTYELPLLQRLFIASGGWLSQLLLAFIALVALRHVKKNISLRFLLLTIAYLNTVHAFYYMATSIYYGYSDGTLFYRHLPAMRPWLIAISSIGMVICCYILSRKLSENFVLRLAQSKRNQILAMSGLILTAAALHFTLYKIEYSCTPNQAITAINASEKQTLSIKRTTETFPLNSALIMAAFLSTLSGMSRHTHPTASPHCPSWRSIFVVFIALSLILALFAYIRTPIDQISVITARDIVEPYHSP